MSDQDKIKRTLQILLELTKHFGVKISDLSERYEISKRTVYRYLQSFKDIGFVYERNDEWVKIAKNTNPSKDISELLHFSQEESYVLQKAIHNLDENNVIKQNLAQKLYSLYNSRNIADTIVRENAGENVSLLCDAIENRKQVVLKDYQSANGSTISDRKVEPFAFTTNYISVWGYDLEKNENRLFKTARIGHVNIRTELWHYEESHQKKDPDVFRMVGKDQYHITLVMSMRAANLMKEEFPESEQYITPVPNNKYRFQGMIYSLHGAGRFILGLMDEIEIVEPQELKKYLNEKIEKKKF